MRPPLEGISFQVYDREGGRQRLADVITAARKVDVILVGKHRGDVRGAAVRLLLLRALGESTWSDEERAPLALSLESLDRDVQLVVDEYVRGQIAEDHFVDGARPWPAFGSDERALMELARTYRVRVLASNAPIRYVNRVARLGSASLRDLPAHAARWLPPLPIPSPSRAYAEEWRRMAGSEGEDFGAHGLDAQMLWDATMAWSIASWLDRAGQGARIMHIAGDVHVARETGIPEVLPLYAPGARTLTVVVVPVDDPGRFAVRRHEGLADVVILTSNVPVRIRR